jgi:DNA-directed RNA polymerase subunit RPC12/RpoP
MELALLESFENYIDAHIIAGRLENEGIQCWLKDENTVTVTPFFSNAVGGIKLMVAADQVEQAKQLLHQFLMEKKSNLACPYCGSHDIELLPSDKPMNMLGAIGTWLVGRYAISTDNEWTCYNCQKKFKEPVDTSKESQWGEEQNS